jgi:septal ring factor EnvC (AmiA/AmiB activator)
VSTLEAASDEQAAAIAIQRGLQVAMDEDITAMRVEFRAQRGLLQSLHLTQQEHTTLLREHSAQLREHSAQLNDLRAGQQRILVGVEGIRELLDRTLNKDD